MTTLTKGSTLRLPLAVRQELSRWVEAGYPHETCGLLIGVIQGEQTLVSDAARAKNVNRARARDRFELDPGDFLRADRIARDAGREIVGIWHSHPDHLAEPSETDRRAAWSGWSYLILEVTPQGTAAMRCWRLVHDRFVEETIEP